MLVRTFIIYNAVEKEENTTTITIEEKKENKNKNKNKGNIMETFIHFPRHTYTLLYYLQDKYRTIKQ